MSGSFSLSVRLPGVSVLLRQLGEGRAEADVFGSKAMLAPLDRSLFSLNPASKPDSSTRGHAMLRS
jgi:hypothetical protein